MSEFTVAFVLLGVLYLGYVAATVLAARGCEGVSLLKRFAVGVPMFIVGVIASLIVARVVSGLFLGGLGPWGAMIIAFILLFPFYAIMRSIYQKMSMRAILSGEG